MAVGLDIGSKTIKIVELDKEGGVYSLRGSGVIGYVGKTPEHVEDEKDLIPLAESIKKLHSDARISKKDIAVSLPEQQVFSRTIRFPLLTDQEIASAVKWEAEQYIPFPLSEAVVQHQIIERRETAPPEVLVLLIAAQELVVQKYLRVVQMAGLNASVVETELMALVRSLAPPQQTVMLLDFGARSTDIAVARNQQLVFTRTIPTAGDAFTRAVAQSLGVEQLQAEEYKKTYGMSTDQLEGKIKGALDPILKLVTDEIKKTIHFYQTEEKAEVPKSIIVSGGTSGMPQVVSVLSQLLNMEVIMGNPFSTVRLDPQVAATLANYAPLYSIAVGLAMRG